MAIAGLLTDQVAIVTGAGRGIGQAISLLLADAGASVVLVARSADEINSVADQIKRRGGNALAIPTDVSDAGQIDHLLVLTMRAFGRIDILVNNAAVVSPLGKVWETSPAAWSKLIKINVVGPYLCSRVILPHMIDRGSGRIINVSSGVADRGVEGLSAYSASKAALERFTETLALEIAQTGVKVSAFRPGIVDTAMQVELRETPDYLFPRASQWQTWHDDQQLRPTVEPAYGILWLASHFANDAEELLYNIDDPDFRARLANDLAIDALAGRQR